MVIIDNIEAESHKLGADIRVGRRSHRVHFASALKLSDAAPEALLLLALPAAMRCGGPLVMEHPVSPQLLSQIPAIQDIYAEWEPGLQHTEIEVPARQVIDSVPSQGETREAIAFSGGVDSFYSILESPRASPVFIHGLDVPLGKPELLRKVSGKLRWAASELDRPLLEMETDLRGFSDRYLKWQLAYGAALSACALLLSEHLDVFGIPAGQSLEVFQPDGAHPVLNPLYGTERVAIRTVGCETERVDKVGAIASNPVVQGSLRVCWENRGDAYNCGVCEKCLRTMAALEAFAALPSYSVFNVPLDYGRLSRAVAPDPSLEMFIRENLRVARARQADPELIRSLEKSLDPLRVWWLRILHNRMPRIVYDGCYRLLRKHRTG